MDVTQNPIFIDRSIWQRAYYFCKIRKAVEYLESHLTEPADLRTVARIACMERTAFSRAFRRNTSMSFHQFVQAYRISQAVLKMQTSDYSVTEIALEVGYSSPAVFDRAFKRVTGRTPSHYRSVLLLERQMLNR